MARHHGRNGQLKIDVSPGALGTTITTIPFVGDWSVDATTPKVDVTAMGDGNTVELSGFRAFKGTFAGFDDSATDVYRIVGDGTPRSFLLCDDTTSATPKWWHGLATFDCSDSGGPGKARAVSLTFSAAGAITQTFDADPPDFP